MKTGGDAFVKTPNTDTFHAVGMFNILSLYKFSTFVDLKIYFLCSNFFLLWTIRIVCLS